MVDGQLVGGRLLSERADLLKQVERAHPRVATASDLESSAAAPGGVKQSDRLAEIDTLEVQRAEIDRKLSILETLVGNLARVDGSKAVVLMSDGFGGDAAAPRVRALIASAERAGVRFHVLDESGTDRDAASGLARGTAGIVARRANAFASSINRIGQDTVATAAPAPVSSDAAPTVGRSSAFADAAPGTTAGETAPPAPTMASGVVVAAPASEPNLLHVRPLAESHVMDLAGGDWSDAAARAGWEAYQRGELEAARAALAPIAARPVAPSWVEVRAGPGRLRARRVQGRRDRVGAGARAPAAVSAGLSRPGRRLRQDQRAPQGARRLENRAAALAGQRRRAQRAGRDRSWWRRCRRGDQSASRDDRAGAAGVDHLPEPGEGARDASTSRSATTCSCSSGGAAPTRSGNAWKRSRSTSSISRPARRTAIWRARASRGSRRPRHADAARSSTARSTSAGRGQTTKRS